jgi:lipopolysaccharide transport system permease protein
MVVFSLIFGRVGDVPSDGVTYPVFSLAGLVVWTYFSTGLIQSSSSLVNNLPLVTKVYFPRIFLPASALLAGLVDFAISLGVLAAVMIAYRVTPPARIVFMPLMIVIAIAATLGVSAGLGALNVRYRDVRYVLPFMSQLWLFLTPVAYPASLLSEPWHTLMGINPMAGAVEGFRWSVLGTNTNPLGLILVSVASATVLLLGGLLYFVRAERSFADVA